MIWINSNTWMKFGNMDEVDNIGSMNYIKII